MLAVGKFENFSDFVNKVDLFIYVTSIPGPAVAKTVIKYTAKVTWTTIFN